MDDDPLYKYHKEWGEERFMHGGVLGRGTYVTCNWRGCLHFGPVVFRVELQPGTRIMRLDKAADPRVIDTLKREVRTGNPAPPPPWKAMPKNKRLTLREVVELPPLSLPRLSRKPLYRLLP